MRSSGISLINKKIKKVTSSIETKKAILKFRIILTFLILIYYSKKKCLTSNSEALKINL